MDKKKICFLFGAGAESDYGLPMGSEFFYSSLFKKNEKLDIDLKTLYDRITDKDEFYSKYSSKYDLFSPNEDLFKEIISNTLDHLNTSSNCYEEFTYTQSRLKEVNGNTYENLHKFLCTESSVDEELLDFYTKIKENLRYYGTIEKYFSTIICPKKYGKINFWKLIRYLWRAYACIIDSFIDKVIANIKIPELDFSSISNILSVIKRIYDDTDFTNAYVQHFKDKGTYYDTLLRKYSKVITTNYSPIAKYYSDNVAYLAGELNLFEIADKLLVAEIDKIADNEIIFPFLFCQTPIKPIVHPIQIREYGKAVNYLDDSDVLIIIGYNINEDDNHITAMIRDFIDPKNNPNKNLIYFSYKSSSSARIKDYKDLCRMLKIETTDNVKVIEFSENEEIKKALVELKIISVRSRYKSSRICRLRTQVQVVAIPLRSRPCTSATSENKLCCLCSNRYH